MDKKILNPFCCSSKTILPNKNVKKKLTLNFV